MELNENLYIKGFNSGYLLAKFETELLTLILEGIHANDSYVIGLIDGKEEYILSVYRDRTEDLRRLEKSNDDLEINLD